MGKNNFNFSNIIEVDQTLSNELNQTESELNKIRSLWRAVITQNLMDLNSNSQKPLFKLAKSRAFFWLTSDSDDFHLVCALADLDPSYVKQKALSISSNGYKWRNNKKNIKYKKQ
jgi:hypothetical protein